MTFNGLRRIFYGQKPISMGDPAAVQLQLGVMSAFRAYGWLLAILAVICCVSCQHTGHQVQSVSRALPWFGFGEPGSGKIMVEVVGRDPSHPGRYYLADDANLESVHRSFGGYHDEGEANYWPPPKVYVTHSDGTRIRYPLSKMTKEQRESVRLRDGDRLDYATATY